MSWIIYKHTNKINGKCYIGQTCQDPKNRWRKGNTYKWEKSNLFGQAIEEFGWDNFTHEIIHDDIKTQEDADRWEQYYIAHYKSWIGFGDECNGYNRNFYAKSRKVKCIETGEIFNSVRSAARKIGAYSRNISKVCKGNGTMVKGYHFCYLEDEDTFKIIQPKPKKPKTRVICLNTLIIYESITVAGKSLGYAGGSHISAVCTGKRDFCGKAFIDGKLEYLRCQYVDSYLKENGLTDESQIIPRKIKTFELIKRKQGGSHNE